MKFNFIIFLFLFPLKAEDPWSVDRTHPFINSEPARKSRPAERRFLNIYQKYVSSFDGARCQMYPTCSHYAALSIRDYGLVWGFLMTVDRLIHEKDKMDFFKFSRKGATYRFQDLPRDNWLFENE